MHMLSLLYQTKLKPNKLNQKNVWPKLSCWTNIFSLEQKFEINAIEVLMAVYL